MIHPKRTIWLLLLLASLHVSELRGQKSGELVQGEEEFSQTDENDPTLIFNKGQDLHAAGKIYEAIALYEQALKVEPRFAEAEYQRGMALQTIGRLSDSETSLRRTISLAPDWALPKISLAESIFDRQANGEIEQLLISARNLEPSNVQAINLLAHYYLATSNDEKLGKLLSATNAVTPEPQFLISFWTTRAQSERKIGNLVGARASVENALRKNPDDFVARIESTEIYLAAKQYKEAVASAERIFGFYPSSEPARILFARALAASGNRKRSIEILKATKTPSDEIRSLLNVLENNQPTDIATLRSMIAKEPKNAKLLGNLCNLVRASDPSASLDYCKRALDLDKGNIEYAAGYGAALVQLKRFVEAANVLSSLSKIDPNNYAVRANLATAFLQMQRFDLAAKEYEWIVKEKPDLAIGYFLLGIAYDRLSQFELAQVSYNKFIALANKNENQLEIDKVKLRLPILTELIKRKSGNNKK